MNRIAATFLAVIRQSAFSLLDLMPYIVVGSFLAAILIRWRKRLLPTRLTKLPPSLLIVCSSLLGSISPLCTIGSVPVVIGLVKSGLPVGAGIAFLATSSLVNPQIMLIAFATVGMPLAVAQWACAVCIGCVTGFTTGLCEKKGIRAVHEKLTSPKHEHGGKHKEETRVLVLFLDQLEHIIVYVILGVLAASTIKVLAPGPALIGLFGQDNPFGVLTGTLLSVPLYVCGGGVLPTLGELIDQGISPGVVLAFIVAGPATRIQALAAISAFLNKRAMIAYVILIWLSAFLAGILFNIAS